MTRVIAYNNLPDQHAAFDFAINNSNGNSLAANIPSGMPGVDPVGADPRSANIVAGGPPQHTPSTAAIAGELAATKVNESFNVRNVEKVTKPNETKNISKLGQIGATFVEPVSTLNPMAVVTPIFKGDFKKLNQNPVLSFMRGKLAQNMPLYNDAIAVPNGFVGRELNIIG